MSPGFPSLLVRYYICLFCHSSSVGRVDFTGLCLCRGTSFTFVASDGDITQCYFFFSFYFGSEEEGCLVVASSRILIAYPSNLSHKVSSSIKVLVSTQHKILCIHPRESRSFVPSPRLSEPKVSLSLALDYVQLIQ